MKRSTFATLPPLLLLLLLLFSLALSGCSWLFGEEEQGSRASSDDASRIVTVGGTVTEIVFALGLGEHVVAVDATSVYPAEAGKATQLPYFRMLAAEPILALEPTLVLATDEAGPDHVFDQLRAAGVEVVIIPSEPSVGGTIARIHDIGSKLRVPERAGELTAQLQARLDGLELGSCTSTQKVMFVYARGPGAVMVAGRGTPAHAIIELAGAKNAFADVEGFKPINPEAVIAAAPDVVLMGQKGAASLGGADGLWATPGLAETPAGRAKRLVTHDLLELIGFGPRLGEALASLTDALGTCR